MHIVLLGKTGSYSEDTVVEELRSWSGNFPLPGVALVQPLLPSTADRDPHDVDIVVITPTGCVALEVKGVGRGAHGVLAMPVNAKWTGDGQPLGICTNGDDPTPLKQARSHAIEWGTYLRDIAGLKGAHVTALIVINQHPRAQQPLLMDPSIPGGVAWPAGPRRPGVVVFQRFRLKDNKLKKYLHHHRSANGAIWDIPALQTLFEALGAPVPTEAELVAEGFGLDASEASVRYRQPRKTPQPQERETAAVTARPTSPRLPPTGAPFVATAQPTTALAPPSPPIDPHPVPATPPQPTAPTPPPGLPAYPAPPRRRTTQRWRRPLTWRRYRQPWNRRRRHWPSKKTIVLLLILCGISVGLDDATEWISTQTTAPQTFRSPHGNTVCRISPVAVRCETKPTGQPTGEARVCGVGLQRRHVLTLTTSDTTNRPCPTRPLPGRSARVLAVGEQITLGDAFCLSRRKGITCTLDGQQLRIP